MLVRGEGMPQYRNPFEKGDLYIKFDVQFPENNWINPDKLSELEDLLPSRPEVPNITGDTGEVALQEFDSMRSSGGGQRHEAYNDSSDDESSSPHGPGVQCAHQQTLQTNCTSGFSFHTGLVCFLQFSWSIWSTQMN